MQPIILLVDDQPLVLETLKNMLKRGPYTVLCAQSGPEALSVLEHESVDVVISDERMPGMAGSEFLAVVRDRFPETVRIILTGYASVETAIKAINEGEIYRFLTKPCNSQDLFTAVKEALDHKAKGKNTDQIGSIAEHLEKQAPGITYVKRDENGYVLIDDDD